MATTSSGASRLADALKEVQAIADAWRREHSARFEAYEREYNQWQRGPGYRAVKDRDQRRQLRRQRIAELQAKHMAGHPEQPRSGSVTVDMGGLERGFDACPLCGAVTNMGLILVQHDDGRKVGFHPRLFHYVDVGHPVPGSELDGDTLLAILEDA